MINMGRFYVYIYFRPNGLPCYVGKGSGKRWANMQREHNPHLANIIRKAGGSLPAVIIREGLSEGEAFEIERALVMAIGREANGGPLVNSTDGGEGVAGLRHSADARAKMSVGHTGRGHTEATRAKMSKSRMGHATPPDVREKISAAQRGREVSAAKRAQISATLKGRGPPPEHLERLRLGNIGRKPTEEVRAKLRAAWVVRRQSLQKVERA